MKDRLELFGLTPESLSHGRKFRSYLLIVNCDVMLAAQEAGLPRKGEWSNAKATLSGPHGPWQQGQEGTRWLAGEPLKQGQPISPSAPRPPGGARQDTENTVTQPYDSDLDADLDSDDDSQDGNSNRVTLDRKQIRSLERDAKQARTANEENARLQRELAFTKAGIDTDKDPRLTYFAKGYDGEMTAEAIRQAAESAGFLAPSASTDDTTADLKAYDRVSQASAGTASRSSDEDRVASLRQAAEQGKPALLAEMQRQGMSVTPS